MSLTDAIDQLATLAAEIRREAFTDDKTSLDGPLALLQEQRLHRTFQADVQVVVFGDLNDFKHINDDYSHEAGDVALRAVGDTLRRVVIDDLKAKAFRRSGDEFVIVLNEESLSDFLIALPSFSNIPFSHNKRQLNTSMSFGYAIDDGKASFDELIQRADTASQIAKRPGGDRCTKWTEDLELNPLVRKNGWCPACNAKISCTLPKENVPAQSMLCPCCSGPLSS